MISAVSKFSTTVSISKDFEGSYRTIDKLFEVRTDENLIYLPSVLGIRGFVLQPHEQN